MVDMNLLNYLEDFISAERKERFIEVLQQRTNYITVATEDVYQMHNTSAVIRSCEVFGIQTAHIIEDQFSQQLDKNISMGAQQWVDVYSFESAQDCMKSLKVKGYKIIATTPHDNSCLLNDFQLQDKTALFFGTEKEGLSKEVIEGADGFLKIPMVGFTESLNVSVSAAIILQKLMQDLKKSHVQWQLSRDEILEKRLDWTKKSIKQVDQIIKRFESNNL